MKPKMQPYVPELQDQYREGRITRREFMRRAALLGVSMSGISAFLASCSMPAPTPAPPLAFTPTPSPAATLPAATRTPIPAPLPTPTPMGPYGELRVGLSTFGPETFDVIKAGRSGNMQMLAPMLDYLIMMDPSEKVNTGIAESWEMAPDGLSWTFHIRKGIKFHNGDDLTAADVKFSLDQYTKQDAYETNIRNSQDRVEVMDDYTVRVYTKGVQPYYWRFVSFVPGYQGLVMPKSYIEKNGMEYFMLHPVGSGPYKFVRHVGGDMVEYEAIDKHYRQVPAFKKLTLVLIPEEATRVAMLKTGEADIVDIGLDSVPAMEAAGMRTAAVAGGYASINFYGANDPRGKGLPIADIRVRQALTLAINRDEIGRTFFRGKMQPALPPCVTPDAQEIDVPYWTEYTAKAYRYDPDGAKRLLTEAGYPKGFTIKLYSMALSGGAYAPALAPVIQGYWLKIGVETQIVPVDEGAFKPLRRSGPNRGPANELVGQSSMFCSDGNVMPLNPLASFFGSGGAWDLNQKGVPDLESQINAALVEPNEAKRRDILAKVLQLATDSYLKPTIGTVPVIVALGPNVDIDLPPVAVAIPAYAESAKHGKQ